MTPMSWTCGTDSVGAANGVARPVVDEQPTVDGDTAGGARGQVTTTRSADGTYRHEFTLIDD